MQERKWGKNVRIDQRRRVAAREALEHEFDELVLIDDAWETLVTGEGARAESLHRWLPYRQQFSPELVRKFFADAGLVPGIVVDPFSGSGTTVIEAARLGQAAVGTEALPVLGWLANARGLREAPEPVTPPEPENWRSWWVSQSHPAQKAMILCAAARTVTGEGKRKVAAPPWELIRDAHIMVAEDLARPLKRPNRVVTGDARRMPLADRIAGGMVTSPPYLSRYDYTRVTSFIEALHRNTPLEESRKVQVTAAVKQGIKPPKATDTHLLPEAVHEILRGLEGAGHRADAAIVRNYFSDMRKVLVESLRVLRPGAPAWFVIGGADIEHEYIPSDLICAAMGRDVGFAVDGIIEARRLRLGQRQLGFLTGISPRESIVRFRVPDED
jgi:hypothetical protein